MRHSTALALAVALLGLHGAMPMPSLPTPKPAKRLTEADLDRISAAEAKRQRRAERNMEKVKP